MITYFSMNSLKEEKRKKIKNQLINFERKLLSHHRYKKGVDEFRSRKN